MDKLKSAIVSGLVMVLWAVVGTMTYLHNYSTFLMIAGFFAVIGFVRFGLALYTWLVCPASHAQHTKKSAPSGANGAGGNKRKDNYYERV